MTPYHHRRVQIAQLLVRHGWEYLLDALGLEGLVSFERRVLHRPARRSRPVDLRLLLEELGPAFVKLGQILTIRADLIPPAYQSELSKLQDHVTPVPHEAIEEIVSRELRGRPSEVFAAFDSVPLASASIGQAHAATLQDGTEVVVKVRRPGIGEEVELDLEIIKDMAAFASQHWKVAARLDVREVAEEFANLLRAELDYLQEAHNAEQLAANFAGNEDIRIPGVFHEFTTSRVITLERLTGTKINDLAALDAAGVDRHAVAERLTRTTAKMVLADGFFHGDPHPGNFFVESSGRIGIIDFGRVGSVDDGLRSQLRRLLIALLRKDVDRLIAVLLEMCTSTGPVDRPRLREELSGLLTRHSGDGMHDLSVGAVLGDVMHIIRGHNLTLPHNLVLLVAVLMADEFITAGLDPGFRFDQALAPYAERHLLREFSPAVVGRRAEQFGVRAEQFGVDVAELAVDLPGQLHRLLEALGDGGLEVHLRAAELEPLMKRSEHLGNRMAASILTAAIIDGLSELAAHSSRRRRRRVPMIAAGVGLVGSLGAYAVWRRSPLAASLHRLRSSAVTTREARPTPTADLDTSQGEHPAPPSPSVRPQAKPRRPRPIITPLPTS